MAKFAINASGAMLLPSLVQVSESISGSVVPLAMFYRFIVFIFLIVSHRFRCTSGPCGCQLLSTSVNFCLFAPFRGKGSLLRGPTCQGALGLVFGCRHETGAGSSHQQVVGCGLGEDNEGRSDLWQITNDAATEVLTNCINTLNHILPLSSGHL